MSATELYIFYTSTRNSGCKFYPVLVSFLSFQRLPLITVIHTVLQLLPQEVLDKVTKRSWNLVESVIVSKFHCLTANCDGFCELVGNVIAFQCPLCQKTNCISCNVSCFHFCRWDFGKVAVLLKESTHKCFIPYAGYP